MAGVDAIRADIAAAVATLEGWRESRAAPGRFGSEPADSLHKAYAVDIAETQATGNLQQRVTEGAWVQTAFVLRYCLKLRLDGARADLDTAMQEERRALAACVSLHRPEYTVALERVEARDTSPEGYMLGSARLIAHHLYDLSP